MPEKLVKLKLESDAVGLRLDVALSRLFSDVSRAYLQKLIRSGKVTGQGGVSLTIPKMEIKEPMEVGVAVSDNRNEPAPQAETNFDYEIIYEDGSMLVINKPAGLVVHPAAGNHSGTVVNALLGRYPEMIDDMELSGGRPGIVHRLDKDTSGALVVAKTPQAQYALSSSFAGRSVGKTYLAITAGIPKERNGKIVTLIGRHPVNRQKMAVVERNGKEAVTLYNVLQTGMYEGVAVALLAVTILTGRTHQIRVHLAHIGYPVAGDTTYGGSRKFSLDRQMLHAWKIKLPHPETREVVEFTAKVPQDMAGVLMIINPEMTKSGEIY